MKSQKKNLHGRDQLHFSVTAGRRLHGSNGSAVSFQNRCPSTKRVYPNENIAKRELHRQQDLGAPVCRVYQCPECNLFHLTSQEAGITTPGINLNGSNSKNTALRNRTIKEHSRKGRVVTKYRGDCGVNWSLL